jgi:4-hydroxybenzoate polyprenyltransferase
MDSIATPMAASAQAGTSVRELLGGCLRLLRPANLVTAAADVFAGWIVVDAGRAGLDWRADGLVWRVSASVCLYAGGVVLNDFFDRNLDAVERPERPIPSGRVPAAFAGILGALLLGAGIAVGFQASAIAGVIAASIAGLVLLYDAVAKHNAAGPVVMGSCRALNLLLGLSAAPAMLPHTWFLALLPLAYIAGITTLSRGEVNGGSRAASAFTLALFAAVVVALAAFEGTSELRWLRLLPFLALLIAKVGPPLWRAYRTPHAATIRAAVHAGVVSLIVLDAAIASAYGGVILGAAILSLTVVAGELARLFPVT